MKHRTARGDLIDMEALSAQNSQQVALGNARMNARGDILGEHGIVLKTQEQIEAEWAAAKAAQHEFAPQRDIKQPFDQMINSTDKKVDFADANWEPGEIESGRPDVGPAMSSDGRPIVGPMIADDKSPQSKTTRRKIVDVD